MDCKEFGHQFSLFSKDKYDEMDDLDGFENHFSTCEVCFEKYSERLSFERLLSDNWGELVVSDPVLKGKDKCLDALFDKDVEGEESIETCDKKFSTDDEKFETLIKKAIADEKRGRLEEAIECLGRALEIRPTDEEVGMHQIRLIRISSVWEEIKYVKESDIIKKIEKDLKLIGDIKKDEHMISNTAEWLIQVLADKAYLYMMYFNLPERYKYLKNIDNYVDGKLIQKIVSLDGSEVFGNQVKKYKTIYFLNSMETLFKFILLHIDSSGDSNKNTDFKFRLKQLPTIIK